MGLLSRFRRQPEQRALSSEDAELLGLTGPPTHSGRPVTVERGLGLPAVYSAVNLLAGAVGSVPLPVYERQDRGRRRAPERRVYGLLHDRPNDEMAADEVWEFVMGSLALWGNAFLAKERDGANRIRALWPLRPDRVTVERKDGARVFRVEGKPYTEADVLHIRAFGTDGLVGISPIRACREALGSGLALQEFAGRFWNNSARPGGVLKHPNELSDKAKKRIKKSWESMHGGLANVAKTAVLEEGMEWQSLGMPLDDAQFIDQAKFTRTEVALIFRLPPYMLAAETGSSLTYSTTEAQSLDFVKWSLRRWLVRIEKSLARDPHLFPSGSTLYPEFLTDALLRGDSRSRWATYRTAREIGAMSVNEIRARENLPAVEDGDVVEPLALSASEEKGGEPAVKVE